MSADDVLMTSEGCPPLDMEDEPLSDEVWEDSDNLPVVKVTYSNLIGGEPAVTLEVPLRAVSQRRRTFNRGKLTTLKFRGCLPDVHCGTRVEVDGGRWSGQVLSMETVWSSVPETSLLLG